MSIESELPEAVRRQLRAAGHEEEPPRARRIFTNRDLDFEGIQAIGFDMDYTLARYRRETLDVLTIEQTVAKLVAIGYPASLSSLANDHRTNSDFAIRGLVVDRRLGNIVKMDRHGYVGRAYHGGDLLERSERKRIYRSQRVGQEKERFSYVDTMFSLPEMSIYAAIVDLIDGRPEAWTDGAPSYDQAFEDTRNCIDECHRDDSIKREVKNDPARYVCPDPELARTLHKLRSAGKRLFLLTNSYFEFSDSVLRFLLEGQIDAYEDWTVYFDWMIMGARKPQFFTEIHPFQEVDRSGKEVGKPRSTPQKGKLYLHGNQVGLQSSLDVEADEVLYVGDHIYGDVVKSKKSSGWRTVLIVEELEHELAVRDDRRAEIAEIQALSSLRDQVVEDIAVQRHLQRGLTRIDAAALVAEGRSEEEARSLLDRALTDARARFDRLRDHESELTSSLDARIKRVDGAFNPFWGSVFAERRDASMFGAQLESYACLYTSRVSNFLYVSPMRYFHAPHGSMPHWRRLRPEG
jgi:HAD superfamily 5'-nucleotidase-like hydrolase